MVEVHPNPPVAMSDAKQQLTIAEFNAMMDEIVADGVGTKVELYTAQNVENIRLLHVLYGSHSF